MQLPPPWPYVQQAKKAEEEVEPDPEEEARNAKMALERERIRQEIMAQQSRERERRLNYYRDLAKKYPEGITEEQEAEKDRDVVRRIVVEGKTANEYFKITHDWGGIYYFRNGVPISEDMWDRETND